MSFVVKVKILAANVSKDPVRFVQTTDKLDNFMDNPAVRGVIPLVVWVPIAKSQ